MMTSLITFAQFSAAVRRKGVLALCLALCTLGLGTSGNAQDHRIITFDAPNSGTLPYLGTQATGINSFGTVTGSVTDILPSSPLGKRSRAMINGNLRPRLWS